MENLTKIVRDWQKPVYNLAFRMLGNEADAADATQEAFTQVLKNISKYDREREFKPWIYKVATNAILNFIRDQKLRREKESRAVMKQEYPEQRDPMEKQELEAVLQNELEKLEEEDRSLVVLHYFQGLSQTELAAAMSKPRTTIQARITRALESIKKGVAAAGLMAVVPSVETALKAMPAVEVPAKLTASLATLTGLSTGATIGGVIMAKTTIAALGIVGVLALGAGFMFGGGFSSEDTPVQNTAPTTADTEILSKADALRAANQQLRDEIATMQAEIDRMSRAALDRQKMKLADAPEITETVPAEASMKSNYASGIDWHPFSEKFSAFSEMLEEDGEMDDNPTDEQQAAMMALFGEFMKITTAAKEMSENPFFDKNIFADFTTAIYGDSLGLSDAQKKELTTFSRSLAAREMAGFNFKDALPLETYRKRDNLIRTLKDRLENQVLSPDQKKNWGKVSGFAGDILRGNNTMAEIGISPKESSSKEISNRWKKAYGFSAEQMENVTPVATKFEKEAAALLKQYGQYKEKPEPLNPADKISMLNDFYDLQAQMEKQFGHLMTPKQRKQLPRRDPTIFRFNYGSGAGISVRRGPGF